MYSLSIQSVFNENTECIQREYKEYTQYGQSVYTVWTKCIHSMDKVYTQYGQGVYITQQTEKSVSKFGGFAKNAYLCIQITGESYDRNCSTYRK